jgi:hypothetical protein
MYLPVHSINYWISTIANIPSTEQDGGINVMSMGRNGSSLNWMTNGSSLAWMTTDAIHFYYIPLLYIMGKNIINNTNNFNNFFISYNI